VKFPPGPILDRDVVDLPNYPKGVIAFDRDGTLVEDAGQHNDLNRLVFLPGAIETISLLSSLGFGIAVATNQAGLESEKFTLSSLQIFNKELKRLVSQVGNAEIDLFVVCPHLATSECDCRKPKPGLLNAIEASGLGIVELFVGNSESDKLAAIHHNVEYMDVNSEDFTLNIEEWVKNNGSS
jgi:D-glycero-D-manno-heptose 1,7-bisphosphate phosphatase